MYIKQKIHTQIYNMAFIFFLFQTTPQSGQNNKCSSGPR